MDWLKRHWVIFIFFGIALFFGAIAILIEGEFFLRRTASEAIATGNLTPDIEGVIIGTYGVHSTVAFGLLALAVALFSFGLVFSIQVSNEKLLNKIYKESHKDYRSLRKSIDKLAKLLEKKNGGNEQ